MHNPTDLQERRHSLTRKNLADGVQLTCITTDSFHSAAFSAAFVLPLRAENAAYAILPYLLYRGTAKCPNSAALGAALDGLYGARIEPYVRKVGESLVLGFVADSIDAACVPDGGQLTQPVIALLGDLLCRPALEDGRFMREAFARERTALVDRIRALANNPRSYAVRRAREILCEHEPFGACEYGTAAAAEALTMEQVWQAYQDALQHARVELFACGSVDAQTVEAAFVQALDLPASDGRYIPEIDACRTHSPTRRVTEEMPVTQGKLTLGLRTGLTGGDDAYPALMLFTTALGGYTGSRLFTQVREARSLCYYASAYLDSTKGLMMVASGIDNDKYEEALGEIVRQMEDLHAGGLTRDELERARRTVMSQTRELSDSPLALEHYWQRQSIAGFCRTPEDLLDALSKVGRGEVMAAGRRVDLDLIYFMKGVGV